MNKLSTLSAGMAMGLTFAFLSMLCALTFALWPDTTLDFFGAFAHGLDFAPLKSNAPLSPSRTLYGVVGLGVVGLFAGVVFARLYNVFATRSAK